MLLGLSDKIRTASKQTAVRRAQLPPDSRESYPAATSKRSCPICPTRSKQQASKLQRGKRSSLTPFYRPGGAPSPPRSFASAASSEGTTEGTAEASQLNHLACRRDAAPDDALSDAGPRHPYLADSPVARERGCQAKRTVASPPRRWIEPLYFCCR